MKHLALVVTTLCLAQAAHADSKAWTAGKKVIPAGMPVVVGMSFDSIRASQLYQQVKPLLEAKAGDAGKQIDKIKDHCGFDLYGELDSVVIATDPDANAGTLVVAFKSKTQKELEACALKVAKADGKTGAITKEGPFMKYAGFGDKDIYVRWLTKNVVAVATSADDKDASVKATAGGITGDKALKTALAGSKTDASLWAVVSKTQELPGITGTMSQAYGHANLAKGNVDLNVHLVMDSDKTAQAAATDGNTKLAALQKDPSFGKIATSVKIAAKGPELVASAQMAEGDLLAMLAPLLGGMH